MVVTGDRDAYQLVDDGDVRIMTTSRGITDTRVYDREGVIDRYGIPPGAGPRLHRAEGRYQRQHPRRPRDRRQDRRRTAPALRVAGGRARPRRRDQRRQAQAEPDRARRRRAHVQAAGRPRSATFRWSSTSQAFVSRAPDRSKLRDTFRQYELREPLRRLEEALGSADAAAPAPEAGGRSPRGVRQATSPSSTRLPHTEVAIAVQRAGGARGRAVRAPSRPSASAVHADGDGRGDRRRRRAARGRGRGDRRPPGDRPRRQGAE